MACADAVRRAGSACQSAVAPDVAGGAGAGVNAAFCADTEGENAFSGLTALQILAKELSSSGAVARNRSVWFP